MKVDLLIEPDTGWHNYDIGPRAMPIRRAVPFYVTSYRSCYGPRRIHRVRSGHLHVRTSKSWSPSTWISWRLWCGQLGSTKHGEVYDDPPTQNTALCRVCEARAIAAGQSPHVELTSARPSLFTPRRRR